MSIFLIPTYKQIFICIVERADFLWANEASVKENKYIL